MMKSLLELGRIRAPRCLLNSRWTRDGFRFLSLNNERHSAAFNPRRALLYVPGNDERKIQKAAKLRADCIALDCEDGVAINQKENARLTIRKFFQEKAATTGSDHRTEWAVRVNSVQSGLLAEDIKTIFSVASPAFPRAVLLPKVESIADLNNFHECLLNTLKLENPCDPINLIFYAESCRTVMDLPAICSHAATLNKKSNLFTPVAVVFGSDDLCASLGIERSIDSKEILYARQRVVLVAKAFNLQAIDMVNIDFKDVERLRQQSLEGAAMGYTGKQVIHPIQVDIVQEAFLPSIKRVQWARGLLDAYERHQKEGKGAFVYSNQMIDAPTMKQAQKIIEISKRCNESEY